MAQPADHAPDLASSSALRIELHRREAESAGVTPHGPSAQHVGADTQTPTFESRAGLEHPLTARRHRHEHDHDPRRRVDQRESTLSQRNGLQVEDLRPTGHHDQIGDSRRLHDRGSRPRGAVEDDVGDALRPSSIEDAPYPIRSDGRHDRLVSLPTVPPPTGTRLQGLAGRRVRRARPSESRAGTVVPLSVRTLTGGDVGIGRDVRPSYVQVGAGARMYGFTPRGTRGGGGGGGGEASGRVAGTGGLEVSAAVPSGARGRPSSPEAAGRWSRAKDGQQRARRTAVLLPRLKRAGARRSPAARRQRQAHVAGGGHPGQPGLDQHDGGADRARAALGMSCGQDLVGYVRNTVEHAKTGDIDNASWHSSYALGTAARCWGDLSLLARLGR